MFITTPKLFKVLSSLDIGLCIPYAVLPAIDTSGYSMNPIRDPMDPSLEPLPVTCRYRLQYPPPCVILSTSKFDGN